MSEPFYYYHSDKQIISKGQFFHELQTDRRFFMS